MSDPELPGAAARDPRHQPGASVGEDDGLVNPNEPTTVVSRVEARVPRKLAAVEAPTVEPAAAPGPVDPGAVQAPPPVSAASPAASPAPPASAEAPAAAAAPAAGAPVVAQNDVPAVNPETPTTASAGADLEPLHTPAKYALFGGVAVAFTVADQLSKIWVRDNLRVHKDEVQIIDGFLSFIHAENPGAAFSLLRDSPYRLHVFAVFTVVAVGVIGNMVRALPARDRFSNVALALVMSGAVGNAIDRLVQGTVTDFIRMYTESPSLKPMLIAQLGTAEWPTYNIADIAIVLGLIMVGVHSLFLEREQTPSAP